MNDSFKLKEIKNFLHINKVIVCAPLETRVRPHNQGKIQKKLGDRWNWICNYGSTNKGRIWLGWVKGEARVRLLLASEQFVIVEVQNTQGECLFHYAAIYGLHTIEDRKSLWDDLRSFVNGLHSPCILMGYYNDVYQAIDKLQGSDITHAETMDFSNFMVDNCLSEAPTSGNFYSWSNKGHGANRISSRIDKAIVNVEWVSKYSDVVVKYLNAGVSDHSPLLFSLAEAHHEGGGRPFRFLNHLADQTGFLDMVKKAWDSPHCSWKMKKLFVNLHKTKEAIKIFHASSYSQAHCMVDAYRRQLETLQANPALNHDVDLQESEKETLEMLKKWSLINMSVVRQKSRISWLSQGDANSKFYFTAVKVRNAKSKIAMLLHNSQGEILTDPVIIGEEIKAFYMKLLGTNSDSIEAINIGMVRKGPRLSHQACNMLIQPVTTHEIDAALASIDDAKAPGLDGFNVVFSRKLGQ
ncbi:uncharacterized protein LOC125495680 [Beta vulgaris subsp. vulgaris]|uniref:uncharacterized protein LOC125495680 n=1 Tax=Beta vulgaris subsp. vulgaris TaxID=3555 RepID=UPI0020372E62|nr:uncharacterized protein LOC125495680 [Beta vulgaris subsp. vulgaris]